ncbi:WbqC family protein [Telluribacter sp. SYSU D00476]|uniref:WbqC family protein n=1 Tax=Telluribacter sp. SYSU D00476 TaxID=2811430 RepID=UPI001FF217AB|nr:WbqC family protein [Telluribacter sp. SYSU D00476]
MAELATQIDAPKEVLIELHYLPSLAYFTCLMSHDIIWLETQENYPKQTYRNRCYVLTTNKVDVLTVPVQAGSKKAPVREVLIDYGQDWIRRHWGCFQSAYGKSPYFEYYAPYLEEIYRRKPEYLFDLNYELLTLCLRLIGIKKDIRYNMSYSENVPSNIFDARSLINDKKKDSAEVFYKSTSYYQTFGNDFVPNLSIVDLLFNQGPEARRILTESIQPTILSGLNKA